MEPILRAYGPSIGALLLGGLGVSIGATLLARSPRGQNRLLKTSGWTLLLFAVAAVAAGGAAVYWTVLPLIDASGGGKSLASPAVLLLVGVLVGLPFSFPGVVLAWNDARADAKRRSKRRETVATKDDRRAYAMDLLRQIQDVSDHPRDLRVSAAGDGGRVLVLDGDIQADEVERLAAALRGDLKELGFRRVEGGSGPNHRWTKV